MKRWVAVTLLLLAGLATGARAGTYVGASAMSTSANFSDAAQSFDTKDYAWKVFGGHTLFIPFLGLEASYRDLGNHGGSANGNSLDADLTAYDVSVRGILPVGHNLRLFAKAGYANISSKGTSDLGGVLSTFDLSSWEMMYGVGVDWTFGKLVGVRAEWETYDVDTSLNSLSVGAYFQF
jgi:hypothetical protein